MSRRQSCLPVFLLLLLIVILALIAVAALIPSIAWTTFGSPSPTLNTWQGFRCAMDLLWNSTDILQPLDPSGTEQIFVIEPGESVQSVSDRLEATGLIRSANTFRSYLVWMGLDTVIQSGTYRLSPAQTGSEIAGILKSRTLTEANFIILPGWRIEEIAAALPTSGLGITPEEFLTSATTPVTPPEFLPIGASLEGFLAPGQYILARTTTADQLIAGLLQAFTNEMTPELMEGFGSQGLSIFQAVTLASIIQREAMVEDEMPMIASVFYNRLAIDIPLQTDPTVQYALGYNAAQSTWWTTPLSVSDLQFDSPFNTYLHPGLPPGPISNPSLMALTAVAFPAQSNYYFFQARCDGSGLTNFAETLDQHLQNNCP
jgi:UPF0755 protein